MENYSIAFKIKQITNSIGKQLQCHNAKNDLTMQQGRLLILIARAGGVILQKDLEKELNVTHPTLVGLIKRMEVKGYITSYSNERDRRQKYVEIKGEAWNFVNHAQEMRKKVDSTIMVGFSEEEKADLENYLDRILENLEEKGDMICGNI